jgi:hypothetical protein
MPGIFFAHELYPLTVRWRSSFILQARWKCAMPGHHLISTLCQGVAKTFSNSWHLLKSSSFILFHLISLALVTIVYIYNTVRLSVPWHLLFSQERGYYWRTFLQSLHLGGEDGATDCHAKLSASGQSASMTSSHPSFCASQSTLGWWPSHQ